jgi:hypothetical protein
MTYFLALGRCISFYTNLSPNFSKQIEAYPGVESSVEFTKGMELLMKERCLLENYPGVSVITNQSSSHGANHIYVCLFLSVSLCLCLSLSLFALGFELRPSCLLGSVTTGAPPLVLFL